VRTANLKDTQSGFKPFKASTSEAGTKGGEFHDASELVPRAQAGEHGAFTQLIEPHMGKVYHGAFRITRNREDAEDACQQALLKAYSHIDQFQGDARFSTWLTRIAINEALMVVRKRKLDEKRKQSDTNSEDGMSLIEAIPAADRYHPDFLYERNEKQRALREAIGSLGENSRDVVHLVGLQERKTKEAARILNVSRSAVKNRFSRARQLLRESLAGQI
jgi:RNA polymerase sigma-70 factor (ECF subfamily)